MAGGWRWRPGAPTDWTVSRREWAGLAQQVRGADLDFRDSERSPATDLRPHPPGWNGQPPGSADGASISVPLRGGVASGSGRLQSARRLRWLWPGALRWI